MKIVLSIFLFMLSSSSCTRMQTLNLVKHNYSDRPDHVIWIQIAGFTEEHIPLLRFNNQDADFKTQLEQVDCAGKMWSYNLFDIRPEASLSFLSQINGSKNINGSCEDFSYPSSWNYLESIAYEVSILESGASSVQSLERAQGCANNKTIDFAKTRFYRMGADNINKVPTFHYQDSPEVLKNYFTPGLYYDKSCQKGICYSSLSSNFKSLWGQAVKDKSRTIFIVRDFSFQNALKKKDLNLARESLLEMDKIIATIKKLKSSGYLILVTGAEAMPIEFPKRGREWSEFESSGKNIFYHNSSLFSPVLAKGPMAENFCGIFEETEMLKRVIYRPESKKFDWDSISPF